MFRGIDSVLIGSENAAKLAEFYREKVGLKQTQEAEMGEGDEKASVFMFEFENGTSITVMDHKDVHGKASQAQRVLVNIEVKGTIEDAVAKLDKAGVKKVQDTYHVEDYGKIATFEDPDGNYFQLVQVREA